MRPPGFGSDVPEHAVEVAGAQKRQRRPERLARFSASRGVAERARDARARGQGHGRAVGGHRHVLGRRAFRKSPGTRRPGRRNAAARVCGDGGRAVARRRLFAIFAGSERRRLGEERLQRLRASGRAAAAGGEKRGARVSRRRRRRLRPPHARGDGFRLGARPRLRRDPRLRERQRPVLVRHAEVVASDGGGERVRGQGGERFGVRVGDVPREAPRAPRKQTRQRVVSVDAAARETFVAFVAFELFVRVVVRERRRRRRAFFVERGHPERGREREQPRRVAGVARGSLRQHAGHGVRRRRRAEPEAQRERLGGGGGVRKRPRVREPQKRRHRRRVDIVVDVVVDVVVPHLGGTRPTGCAAEAHDVLRGLAHAAGEDVAEKRREARQHDAMRVELGESDARLGSGRRRMPPLAPLEAPRLQDDRRGHARRAHSLVRLRDRAGADGDDDVRELVCDARRDAAGAGVFKKPSQRALVRRSVRPGEPSQDARHLVMLGIVESCVGIVCWSFHDLDDERQRRRRQRRSGIELASPIGKRDGPVVAAERGGNVRRLRRLSRAPPRVPDALRRLLEAHAERGGRRSQDRGVRS